MWRKLRAVLFSTALLCPHAVPGGVRKADGIRVTYLGVNGYLLETGGRALLVDPYFTRVPLGDVVFNAPIASDLKLVADGLTPLPRRIDALLATHGHAQPRCDSAS